MSEVVGRTVLVTGGASGIGYLTGRRLVEHEGAGRLVIWDVDEDAMRRVVDELAARGYRADGFVVDVADLAQVRRAVAQMRDRGIDVDLLVNNAGIVAGRSFAELSHEEVAHVMAVNALAPMHVARELLPGMLERGRGHVVNVASAAGMMSTPGISVYCASKWALTGWSDALHIELARSRSGVRVTTVAPFYIDTGMFAGVRSRMIPILHAEHVARAIVGAIRRDRRFLRLPWLVNLLPLLRGLLPARAFDLVVGEWMGVYDSMRTFTGRRAGRGHGDTARSGPGAGS